MPQYIIVFSAQINGVFEAFFGAVKGLGAHNEIIGFLFYGQTALWLLEQLILSQKIQKLHHVAGHETLDDVALLLL